MTAPYLQDMQQFGQCSIVSFDREPSVILDTRAKVAAINGSLATKSSAESGGQFRCDKPGEIKIRPARASCMACTNSVAIRGLMTYPRAPVDRQARTKSGSE